MSKILVPFHITDYTGSPGSVQPGFKKFYLKNGYFKLFDGAAVSDLVLDRPLDGFVPLIGTITSSDTVLTALEKLQYEINGINTGMVGPGTPNRITKFITPSTIGDSLIYDNGTNVGFGTTTPIAKIHIVGNTGLAFSTNTSNHGMAYIKTVVMDSFTAPYEGDLTFSAPYWNGSLYSFPERVRIAAHTGYLGINQTLPTQHLHVEGNARITGAVYDSNNSPGTNGQILSSTVTGIDWVDFPALPYVPTSRTLTINGVTYDLTADRSWTIAVAEGLPAGGTAGQILTKVDSVDYNAIWQDNYADWTSVVKHIVKNDGTALITKGTPVYTTGSNGTNILVGKAGNGSEATSSKTMGLMQSNITTTGGTTTGFVITEGLLAGVNTAGTVAGDPIWLGPTGTLIYGLINKPYAPQHLVFIGIVTKVSAGNGEIFVKVQNGFELEELHNVDLITTTPANGEVLGFDGTLWKNKTIASLLGYTPFQLPSLTSGSVLFSDGTTIAQDNANFFIDNINKRVGFGTNAPVTTLHVVGGDLHVGNALGTTGLRFTPANDIMSISGTRVIERSGSQLYYGFANQMLHLRTGSATRLYIDNTGNVGIGTTNPDYKLHVAGTSYFESNFSTYTADGLFSTDALPAVRTRTPGGTSRGVRLGYRDFGSGEYWGRLGIAGAVNWSVGIANSAGTNFSIGLGNRVGTDYVTVVSGSGNVGIGTTTPNAKLEVNGGAGDIFAFENQVGRYYYSGYSFYTPSSHLVNIGSSGYWDVNNSNGNIRLDSSGNVGIGTTAPTVKLTVVSETNGLPTLGTASGGLFLASNNGLYGIYSGVNGLTGASWLQAMRTDAATAYNILINPVGGNVIIGDSLDNGGKLQIKAPGALSTDIALRVRNSADTGDLMTVDGLGITNSATFNATTNNLSYKVQGVNVLDYGNGVRIGYFNGVQKITLYTNAGTPQLTVVNSGSVLIGTTTEIASSKLTVESTTQGFLPPRMTNAQRLAIATPAIGLMVYCTDTVEGVYVNKSTGWTFIG